MKNIPPQQLQSSEQSDETAIHLPVLLEDCVRLLAPEPGQTYLDLTAGYGGHASRIMDVITPSSATLVDRDEQAIAHLGSFGEQGARLIHDDFGHASEQLAAAGEQFDMILVDLGVSSPQFDRADRGFSLKRDGLLDMRMDGQSPLTAADIINRTSERGLVKILQTYGEERLARARNIARAIVRARPLRTTQQLADLVLATHRGGYQKIHPATRTFQAIRIAVNDELGQIERMLHTTQQLLRPGGRLVIISFHSLEDRLVKQYLCEADQAGYEAELRLITKKPILGSTHDVHNPRARSAILRAAVKT